MKRPCPKNKKNMKRQFATNVMIAHKKIITWATFTTKNYIF